jgi:cytochrome c553
MHLILTLAVGLSSALLSQGSEPAGRPPAGNAGRGHTLYTNVCAACHGERGQGNKEVRSPSIASMPEWYVVPQLSNFKTGKRGDDPDADPTGHLMAAIGKTLEPQQMADVAAFIATLPPITPDELTLPDADLDNGRFIFQARCMECHRYNASGELAFGSPPLTGRQHWYLADQIRKFKAGVRGAKQGDEKGAKMVFSSNFIADEYELRDVMAYIMTLNPRREAQASPEAIEANPFESSESQP